MRLSGAARADARADARQHLLVGESGPEELKGNDKGPEKGGLAKVEEAETVGMDDAEETARISEGASQLRGSTLGANDMPELLAIVQTTCATLAERLKSHLLEQQRNPREPSRDVRDPLSGSRLSPAAALAAQAARRLLGEVEAAAYLRPQGACMIHSNATAHSRSESSCGAFQAACLSPQWFDVSTPPLASRDEASVATSAAGSSTPTMVGGGSSVTASAMRGAEGSHGHGCSTNSAASSCCDICGTMHLEGRLASRGCTPREDEHSQILSGRKCLDQPATSANGHLSLEDWVDNVLRGVDDACPLQQS